MNEQNLDTPEKISSVTDTPPKALPEPDRNTLSLPEAPANISVDQKSSLPALNLDGRLMPPKAIHKFFSGVKMIQSPLSHQPHFRIQYEGYKLDAGSEREFRLSMMNTLFKMVSDWSVYLGTVAQEEEPVYREANTTVSADAGFDVRANVLSLLHENVSRIARTFLHGMRDEALNPQNATLKRYRKKAFVACTKDELVLLDEMDHITRSRFEKVRKLHDIMSNFRDMTNRIAPLGIVDDELVKFYRPDEQRALTEFISNNFRIIPAYVNLMHHYLTTHIALNVIADDATAKSLTQVLSARTTQASLASDYPTVLRVVDAQEFLRTWITVMFTSRFAKVGVEVPLRTVAIAPLMQCILAKLYLGYRHIDPEHAIDIDNYIARHLLMNLPGFDVTRLRYDLRMAESRQVNYLELAITSGALFQNIPANVQINDIVAFLRTTPLGGGWANAGLNDVEILPANCRGYFNRDDIWYNVPFGRLMRDRQDTPLQFIRFERFVTALTAYRHFVIEAPYERLAPNLVRLLAWCAGRSAEFNEMVWYLQRIVRFYTLNSLHIPDRGEKAIIGQYETMMAPKNGIFSSVAFANWNGKSEIIAPIGLLHSAWRANEDFNGLVNAWHTVNDYMTDEIFGRRDKLTKAYSYVTDSTGLLALLKNKLIDENEFVSCNLPGRSFMTAQFNARFASAKKFIDNNLLGFGIVPNFVYKFNPPAVSRNGFAREIDYTGSPSIILSYKEVQDLIATEKYAALLRDARDNGKIIRFDIPVDLTVHDVGNTWVERPSIIVLPTGTTYVHFNAVHHDFTFDDVLIDDTRAEVAERQYCAWGSPVDPFVAHDVTYIQSLFKQYEVEKNELTFVTEVSFVTNQ